jgi:LAO/AO transport system kinase
MSELAERVLAGDPRAIARLISYSEDGDPRGASEMKMVHPKAGNAYVIGVTGVMGAGKSTLVCEMARELRRRGKTVGIVAVDPTSPFSGGALLGDRIRMSELVSDEGIFIRSMGTRGMLGGLASAVFDAVEILDASGKELVIVETVGVGQAEVDIIKIADTTMVVLVPGLGDSIQTIKAGIMEIADIFVVNKADRPGIERTVAELESLIDLSHGPGIRRVPVLQTTAKDSKGVKDLLDEVNAHEAYIRSSGRFDERRKARYQAELVEIIRKRLMTLIFDEDKFKGRIESLLERIQQKEMDPYSAADEILAKLLK